MKVKAWLETSTQKLKKAGIATARLDTLVLLGDTLAADKSYVLAHLDLSLTLAQQKLLSSKLNQRLRHLPLAYVRGKTEFYGRDFLVNKDTLEPRPESETMIELLKSLGLAAKTLIVDVGTGSGALAITAKLELPKIKVIGTEISKPALTIAQKNAKKLDVDVKFLQGDLLQPLPTSYFQLPTTLLCNLPYVPDSHTINQAAMQEPKLAIFGGSDGLDLYRQLFDQITERPHKPKFILTESLPPQHQELAKIAQNHGYNLSKTADFIQLFTKS